MNVLLLVKQVVDTEARIKIRDDRRNIATADIKYILGPYDEFVLEEGVRIKEKIAGTTVTALSLGPARAKEMLRTCIATGADKAVLVNDAGLGGGDAFATARTLFEAIKKFDSSGWGPFDIILCGKKAVGVDRGAVGPMVAQMLGVPFVSNIVKLEIADDKKSATVTRDIEGGREVFQVQLPAVFSCEKGLNKLRHTPLKGIMMSKSKPIQELTATDLEMPRDAGKSLSKLSMTKMEDPPPRKAGRIIQGDADTAVAELVRLLREEAKVL